MSGTIPAFIESLRACSDPTKRRAADVIEELSANLADGTKQNEELRDKIERWQEFWNTYSCINEEAQDNIRDEAQEVLASMAEAMLTLPERAKGAEDDIPF